MVLPAPTDPERMKSLDEEAYRTVIARLKQFVGVLVLDCGTELQSDAARAAQDAADQIVLVSDAHPAAASLVAESASLLTQIGPPITLVVNKMPKRKRSLEIDLAGFDQLIPDARGLVTIADEPAAAKLVASGRFDWRDAPRDWRRSVRELALVLISDWVDVSVAR